ncbi:MAG: tRNA uridine-5-carboxymethylaminomethyl(34) synthesis GTPase MnmE [Gammaproteobacteria bacterium]|nr:tRNA uridine-5-carboxymethylaminomethyl(34) synthesis GTPase MnmE [Gammaproteobacteria bacterium]MDH3406451.1 tRNA uridine-5-carboxymethylaminomethyl(34) synthesis GTPase MnmE [Gammaproteobacteria bacterium]MDH3563187.1 tRNA uridine-5-carboxymethylaminomethyl(34) synthesis GTPase MnmE [Gammaproteobacteria bacterium]MDH5487081.1 tRNA uridine-5-carboxymethylaminomethyl(34) synthesis GTPase MnmE [Gammaproteobacteria bacterium]
MADSRTIAAVATPPGRGGIGIVRLSGTATRNIAMAMLGKLPAARHATFANFLDVLGQPLDRGLAIFFPAPHSFTGEDVLELHGHGGPVVLDMVLHRALELGAHLARPGEFSERAFLNGKLDLAQAEAVADIIEAGSQAAARSALRSLEGEFSQRVHTLVEGLTRLRMYVEAAIDFPEEEIDFLADERITQELDMQARAITALLASAQQGVLLHDGMTVVLAGPPNSGKSSLLNALATRDTAIVSPVPGTTRDVLRERIHIDGMPLHIIDTAGLRESQDAIESEGIRRARAQMERADRLLLVIDDSVSDARPAREAEALLPAKLPRTVLRNKIDLTGRPPGIKQTQGEVEISLSAKTGEGLEHLHQHLKECMGFQSAGEGTFMARRRHLDAIRRAEAHLAQGNARLRESRAGELLAEELRLAQQALSEITGEFTPEDLLGRIFSSFCIGK